MIIRIVVEYDEEFKEVTVATERGLYSRCESFPLESLKEVREALDDARNDVMQSLKEAGMK